MLSLVALHQLTARKFRTTFGLSHTAYSTILPIFTQLVEADTAARKAERWANRTPKRKTGGGRKATLNNPSQQLAFLLYYFKNYPKFDTLGFVFGMSGGKANKEVHRLWSFLAQSLVQLQVMPKNEFADLAEFEAFLQANDCHTLLADATERPVQRPKNADQQKIVYSGKKKRHTAKNTILSTLRKVVLFIGKTQGGHRHDFSMFKADFPPQFAWFASVQLFIDLGYLGFEKDYHCMNVHIPYRKPRKSKNNPNPQLSEEQKQHNKSVSSVRIAVEHAIGAIKRFDCLVQRWRNRKAGFLDAAINIAAAIWNLELKLQPDTL